MRTEVILFGSRAMGNFQPGSDIDICLKGPKDSDLLYKILNEYDELYLPWKLGMVIWDKIENQDLREHIERVGIKVA